MYALAEPQSGYLTAQQAIEAGIARSTLSYNAREAGTLLRVGHGLYRLRRFPASPHEHVVRAWLPLARSGAVISHLSALEMHDLTDLIADQVHVTLPRAKRGSTVPEGVKAHFTQRPVDPRDLRRILGVPVTGVERTIADVVRSGGWTEQMDLAVRRALERGQTTAARLSRSLPAAWQRRLHGAADLAGP